jgi:molybdate transport system substrate-binding protein
MGRDLTFTRRYFGAGLLLVLAVGFAQVGQAQVGSTLTVFAASSLTNAFNEVGPAFQRAHPGQQVRLNFGASSALRSQIQLGAPADLFASADYEQMEPLQKAGLVSAPATFARNRLTVVVPKENPARLGSPRDLGRPGLRLVTTAEAVPIGRYTREVLVKLGKERGYPANYLAQVNRNVVSREPNVRAVLAKVELGEADAAVVYETDARASKRVKAISIPEKVNVIAEYPVAVLSGSANKTGAEAFVRYVRSSAGRAVLTRHGFR